MRRTIKTIQMEISYESSESSDEEVAESHPRVRGRGRRGGRGRGRGSNIGVATVSNINSRQGNINTTVDGMSFKRCKDMLKKLAEREPSMLMDFIGTENHSTPSLISKEIKGWCVCGNCRQMPTAQERVCCGYTHDKCLSVYPDFQVVCLDEAVLEVAARYRSDMLATPVESFNKRSRHTAYRQFILWQHGRLGAGHRKIIPSCCVSLIREKYPDPLGFYTGFLAHLCTKCKVSYCDH